MRSDRVPLLATPEGCRHALAEAGLDGAAERVRVGMPDLSPANLVEWRLGMAQHAQFVDTLPDDDRIRVTESAIARLGPDPPPLVRSVMVLTVVVGGPR